MLLASFIVKKQSLYKKKQRQLKLWKTCKTPGRKRQNIFMQVYTSKRKGPQAQCMHCTVYVYKSVTVAMRSSLQVSLLWETIKSGSVSDGTYIACPIRCFAHVFIYKLAHIRDQHTKKQCGSRMTRWLASTCPIIHGVFFIKV